MNESMRRPPPPPPSRARPTTSTSNDDKFSTERLEIKVQETMKENTDLRQLLNSLRLDQRERSLKSGINRPPPPPKTIGNGRGRGNVKQEQEVCNYTRNLLL